MGGTIAVGVALPQFDYSVPGECPLQWPTVVDWAQRAESLGFDSVWMADHLFLSIEKYGGPPGDHGVFDPILALAALARLTTRVRLGTLVLCAQLRHPTIAAKQLATLDLLSDGRLTVGIGAGWSRPEFDAAGIPFEPLPVRHEQLVEAVDLLVRLFEGDHVTFSGAHWSARDARFLPHAMQRPRPPIWVGGRGDRLLDVVARCADGWNTCWVMTPDDYRSRLRVLHDACERHGRDPATVTLSLGLKALVGEDEDDIERRFERLRDLAPRGVVTTDLREWRVGRLVGTPEQVSEQLGMWSELGVATLIADTGALPFSVTASDDLDLLASALP